VCRRLAGDRHESRIEHSAYRGILGYVGERVLDRARENVVYGHKELHVVHACYGEPLGKFFPFGAGGGFGTASRESHDISFLELLREQVENVFQADSIARAV